MLLNIVHSIQYNTDKDSTFIFPYTSSQWSDKLTETDIRKPYHVKRQIKTLIISAVTHVIEARAQSIMLIIRISIVHCLDLNRAALAIWFLNSSEYDLVRRRLTALLIECLRAGRVLPVLSQVLLMSLLLLFVVIPGPLVEVSSALTELVNFFGVFWHESIGLLGSRSSGLKRWWWLIFVLNDEALLHLPWVWLAPLLVTILVLVCIVPWLPSENREHSAEYFSYCWSTTRYKLPHWCEKAFFLLVGSIIIGN